MTCCHLFGQWDSFKVSFCPFDIFSSFFEYPCFLAQNVLNSSWTFSTLDLETTTFARSLGSFQWKIVFKSQDMGASFALCYWGIGTPIPSQWTEVGNTCSVVCGCMYMCIISNMRCVHTYTGTCYGQNAYVPRNTKDYIKDKISKPAVICGTPKGSD